ncbi:VPS4-associated protein 1 [Colletotrichum phormii]|uniref:VPS4-associated protein 1 n=1 Tax=Colletotrichum phormii TaxID=359342 RepID=A0AAI9ZF26_9PEZI|nr:VPS4-associated protein 1 [Colletotrichum phormii]KAK1623360.1 VPS4-associated protein 1 [Colletotrichum phormii]
MSFSNIYTHRKVAEKAAKGCDVCYRATSSVLVAPENKDFFYVCPSHLKDKNFCSPIIDKEAVEAKKKKALEDEVERVKKEYEDKQKKKKEKEEKEKEKDKEKEKEKEKDKEKDKDDKKTEDEKKEDSAKASCLISKDGTDTPTPAAEDEPRIFALRKNFFGARLEKKRQMEIAKRNRERLQQPNLFPSVPKGMPGS